MGTDGLITPRVAGDDAAMASTNGSDLSAWSSAPRRDSVSSEILSVSLRTSGFFVAAVTAPRRKTPAQINRSTDAPTCTAISACREARGRAPFVISPRMVDTRSTRVACRAGASPKNTVDAMAPTTRNTNTRQSEVGAARLNRLMNWAISGGSVVITA